MPTLATNKRARFDYEILETYEAGIVLTGQEVKSVRGGNVSLAGAFVTIRENEAWLTNAHIGAYAKAGPLPAYDPTRSRKLLLNRREIATLLGKRKQAGLTLLPLSLYTKPTRQSSHGLALARGGRNRLKLEIGLARGKKKYEKREHIKKRDTERVIRETMRR